MVVAREDSTSRVPRSGYVILAALGVKTRHIPVCSADEASLVVRAFIDGNGFGSSELKSSCGEILSNEGALVARVSYNGRVWTPDGQLLQELPGGHLFPQPEVKLEAVR